MINFIKEFDDSLNHDICDKLIEIHNNSNEKYKGITASGLNQSIKDTTDLIIKLEDSRYKDMIELLNFILGKYIKLYMEIINNKENYLEINNHNNRYKLLQNNLEMKNGYMIQKYIQNEGKYIYHHDHRISNYDKNERVLTYLWYLNDSKLL